MSVATEISRLQTAKADLKTSIEAKGVTVPSEALIDTYDAYVDAIVTGGGRNITVAELPNCTFELRNSLNVLVDTKTNDAVNGGIATLLAPSDDLYTITAIIGGVQQWTNTVEILGAGVYEVKTGKPLDDYTEAQIAEAANGGYAKYMWSVGDVKNTTFIGNTRPARIVAFDHNILADTVGKAGITFMVDDHTTTYQHWTSNINAMGWEGSLIRTNGLPTGAYQYLIDTTVTNTTAGTYYTYNKDSNDWLEKTLPADFAYGIKYYKRNTIASDGAFYSGLTNFKDYVKPVLNETMLMKSKDYVFIMSECEIFGNTNRSRISGSLEDGLQYDYFKNDYQEGKMCISQNYWLRSFAGPMSFNNVYSYGYPSNSNATGSYIVRPCFCL